MEEKIMKKRIASLLLAGVMAVSSVTACGSNETESLEETLNSLIS